MLTKHKLTQNVIDFLNAITPKWVVNERGEIDVDDSFIMPAGSTEIPVQLGTVNGYFTCDRCQLTTCKNFPRHVLVYTDLGNCAIKYLWGIGKTGYTECWYGTCLYGVLGKYHELYPENEQLNGWIIQQAQNDLIFPYFTFEENVNWIKQTHQYSCLIDAPEEIRQHFSPAILYAIDNKII